jgi:quinoprotein glucose dehydrogenase
MLLVAAGLTMVIGAIAVAQIAPRVSPSTAAASEQNWSTFNGDLSAHKYATADQITPANVGRLKVAWQVHTHDMSAPGGKIPPTDWSATPIFANGTVYVGTPFYRVFAVSPDTGRVKWVFDTHAQLKALTQPDLKSRGVAYWEAANVQPGHACEKMVYLGTMAGKLFAVDADSGRACPQFGRNGVLDINQWNTIDPKWPLSILQPPTVYKDTLFIGWAGRD